MKKRIRKKVLNILEIKNIEITEEQTIAYLKLTFYNLKQSGNTYFSVNLIIGYMYELMKLYDQNEIIDYVKKFVKENKKRK